VYIGGPGEFDIVLSFNTGLLAVTVVDDDRKPVYDATVVLVPDAPLRERSDLYFVTGSSTSGNVHWDGVAPGAYKLFAWDDVPSGAWLDPDFIRIYESRGQPVRIIEGGLTTAEVKLITQP
jgi:hypothetical protein